VSREGAADRLRRILAVIPYLLHHGPTPLVELAARFEMPVERMRDDIWLAGCCEIGPANTPIELYVDDDDDVVHLWLDEHHTARLLDLTPTESVAVVAAGRALLALPGGADEHLAAAVDKLEARVQARGVVVDLATAAFVPDLRTAVAERRVVELVYYSQGRDELSERLVEPNEVRSIDGTWYLAAWCRRAEAPRLFRVDRIRDLRLLDERFTPRADVPGVDRVFAALPDDPRVTFELGPAAGWVLEQYPHEEVVQLGDGWVRATLAISGRAWFERLVLRLGPTGHVVGPDDWVGVAREAARRVLARYDEPAPSR
jgi:proteasome accessory factor C